MSRRIAAGVLALGLALTSCQSSGVKTHSDTGGSPATPAMGKKNSGNAAKSSVKSNPSKPASAAAHVGATITLTGNSAPGEKVAVTIVKVVAHTKSTDGFSKPSRGKRFAAVQVRLHNLGRSTYSDSPDNSVKVLDRQGQSFPTYIVGDVTAGPGFAGGSVNIAPGDSQLGYVTFQLPAKFTIAKVQFGTDSGFGQTGEWLNP